MRCEAIKKVQQAQLTYCVEKMNPCGVYDTMRLRISKGQIIWRNKPIILLIFKVRISVRQIKVNGALEDNV